MTARSRLRRDDRRTRAAREDGRRGGQPRAKPARRSGAPRARRRVQDWTRLSDAELLERPIAALGLRLEGTALEARIHRLEAELERAGLRFRPRVWLGSDWFSPDGVPGFSVPFYLAHPRLARLERHHMFEVEGGTQEACMRLLRHETAHALDNAYRLRRRKRWRESFGPVSRPYRDVYVPRPTSRRYVLNLDYWYAQSHPLEDFAETFAVWLQPGSRWRQRYAGWPALRKLETVDALVREVARQPPRVHSRARPDRVESLGITLREYYREKQAFYRHDQAPEYDDALLRVFSREPGSRRETPAALLMRSRGELRRTVSGVTGQHPYLVDQVLNELIVRSRALGLRLAHPERSSRVAAAALLTMLTTSFAAGGPSEYRR